MWPNQMQPGQRSILKSTRVHWAIICVDIKKGLRFYILDLIQLFVDFVLFQHWPARAQEAGGSSSEHMDSDSLNFSISTCALAAGHFLSVSPAQCCFTKSALFCFPFPEHCFLPMFPTTLPGTSLLPAPSVSLCLGQKKICTKRCFNYKGGGQGWIQGYFFLLSC